MVSGDGDTSFQQGLIELVHIFSGGTVNDPAFLWVLLYVVNYKIVFVSYIFHTVVQIFSVKACYCHSGVHKIQDA